VVAFLGDGATADVGFQNLSGAAERGENLIYICYDNEAYMNTGVQRSGTTPRSTWTFTTPVGPKRRGKEQPTKYMPLIMALHGVPYVATAAISNLEDYATKLSKAISIKDGMAYIHLFSPCPTGWRAPLDMTVELSRMAVETNYFPLWEMEHGKYRLTYEVKNPKPIQEYTKLMGRFAHLTKPELESFQQAANERFDFIKSLTCLGDGDKVSLPQRRSKSSSNRPARKHRK
jgi:pyruvate/2-oxoacid:ferredoxin oxidoreductase beta subunit